MGQLIVLLTAGIDLSVGPLTGLTVVILSFFCGDGQSTGDLILGLAVAFATALAVGFANGFMVRKIGLTPVIATLSTYIGLQGVALSLRSTPAGYFRPASPACSPAGSGRFPLPSSLASSSRSRVNGRSAVRGSEWSCARSDPTKWPRIA